MGQFKSKLNKGKKGNGCSNGDHKKVKYVLVSSKKTIYLVTGEQRESKYSYDGSGVGKSSTVKSAQKKYNRGDSKNVY